MFFSPSNRHRSSWNPFCLWIISGRVSCRLLWWKTRNFSPYPHVSWGWVHICSFLGSILGGFEIRITNVLRGVAYDYTSIYIYQLILGWYMIYIYIFPESTVIYIHLQSHYIGLKYHEAWYILYIYICNRLRLYFHPQQFYRYPHSYPISGWLISIISPDPNIIGWSSNHPHTQLKWDISLL